MDIIQTLSLSGTVPEEISFLLQFSVVIITDRMYMRMYTCVYVWVEKENGTVSGHEIGRTRWETEECLGGVQGCVNLL